MSDSSQTTVVQLVSSVFITNYCGNAMCTLVVYDWLLTINQDVDLFWRPGRRIMGASTLYLLSRFVSVLYGIVGIINIFPITSLSSCTTVTWIQEISAVLELVLPGVFSTLRVYGLSEGKWRPTATILTLLLSLVSIIINLVNDVKWTIADILPSPLYCSSYFTISPEQVAELTLTSRGSVIAVDTIVIFLTWKYTYGSVRMQQKLGLGPSFAHSIFHYGNVYFIILAMLNISEMIFSALPNPSEDILNIANYLSLFITPITSIIISRFLLNLRQVDRGSESESIPSSADPQFATPSESHCDSMSLPSFIESFGAPVNTSLFESQSISLEFGKEDTTGNEQLLDSYNGVEAGNSDIHPQ